METPEEALKSKLDVIRESIVGNKFVLSNLQDRLDNVEGNVHNCQSQIHELRNNTIRTDERIATIQRYLDTMSGDVRAVRNSVMGAVVVALVLGTCGLAISTFKPAPAARTINDPYAIAGRTA